MQSRHSLLATTAALLLATSAHASDNPPFPRLAGTNMGAPHNYDDPAYQAKLAKLHMSVLHYYPGWGSSRGANMEQVIRAIKQINPETKIFLYHISMELSDDNLALASYKTTIDQMKWWAYPLAVNGTRIQSTFGLEVGQPIFVLNNTLHTPKNGSGYQMWEWDARWTADNYFKPIPSVDGIFEDNVFWKPRIDADWNRDGVVDLQSGANAGTWLRQAYRKRFELLRQLMPGKNQIGNIADWGDTKAVLTDLSGSLNGGIMEGIVGASYSPESWASWSEMMRWYRKTMAAIASPKLVVFNQHGKITDYQAMRYGLASCLLDDAYYSFSEAGKGYTGVIWFDEYDAKLGHPLGGPTTTAWQKGVYRRDYENGIALVNPKGNGAVDVVLETDFKRLSGTQAPTINSGQTVRTLHLNDRDGIILLRQKSVTKPAAPQLTIQD